MAIKGLPKIEPNARHGFTCSCEKFWAHGATRQEAFASWQEARKEPLEASGGFAPPASLPLTLNRFPRH